MKNISSALQSHLDGELTTLAYLVKVTRTDGVIKGFTTHDRDIVTGGITYKADGAFTPSAIASSAGLATDNLEITGILDSSDITEPDIIAGRYDFARVDIYACNWADLTQGLIPLRRGWLGNVVHAATHYVAELRGLHDLLQRPVGETYTPECRFDLGDRNCGVNLAALTTSGSVTNVTNAALFSDSAQTAADGYFNYGMMIWLSGANAGLKMEIKNWTSATQSFELWLPMPNAILVHDTYSVIPGCDKRFVTCKNKFANGLNFGGFPYIPGIGNILKYPDNG